MDGHWFRKLSFSGFALLGAVGCNRNSVQPTDVQPGVPMATTQTKSLWGSSTPQVQPTEVVVEAPKKGPPKPETEVSFADAYMAKAMDEKTPDTERAGAFDTARTLYQKALKQDPNNKTALLGLARFYTQIGEMDKAIDTYQKCLKAHPGDRDVTVAVARVYARAKDFGNAVAWYDQSLKLDPENIVFRKEKAFCLAFGGQWEAALKVFETIMPEAQARYNIARVLEGQNRAEASRQQLHIALQADPNCEDARAFLTQLDSAAQPQSLPNGTNDRNAIQRTGYVGEQ